MSERYLMDDGSIVEPDNARKSWDEGDRWDGSNMVSLATGSQWDHERLCLSRRGRYYIVSHSQWQGSTPSANYVSDEDAARWLMVNEHSLPADLESHADAICE